MRERFNLSDDGLTCRRSSAIEEMQGARGGRLRLEQRGHCARSISPKRYPRGVFTFRSIEEAQHPRDTLTVPSRVPRSS